MTYPIDTGFASHIRAIQTTQILNDQGGFDVHPDHADTTLMVQLEKQFNLPHPLIIQKQEHKDRAIEYNTPPSSHFKHRADACFSRQKNTICAVLTADCLPVLLADKNGHWVAAIHCGWRSLFQNIICKTFQKIKANARYTQAYLGPCIQAAAYEVDADFVTNFLHNHPDCGDAFSDIDNGKSHANLQQIARQQLNSLGITDIVASSDCTFAMTNQYHSWRRDQSTKRMATLVWMN